MKKLYIKLIILLSCIYISGNLSSEFLEKNLKKNSIDSPAEIIFIGHSRTGQSFNVNKIQKKTNLVARKFWFGGADVFDRFAMIKFYLNIFPKNIKYICYDVDFTIFKKTEQKSNSYKALYPYIDNIEIDNYIKVVSGGGSEYYFRKIFKPFRYDINSINAAARGFLGKHEKFYTNTLDVEKIKKYNYENLEFYIDREKYNCFIETMKYVVENNINVLLINTPLPDFVLKGNNIDYLNLEDIINDIKEKFPGKINYLNYSNIYADNYLLFNDPMHLNKNGMEKFSDLISSDILALERDCELNCVSAPSPRFFLK